MKSLLLLGLGSSLGDLGVSALLGDLTDDTDSDGGSHITDGETTKWRVLEEGLNNHGLGWSEEDNGGITVLDELGLLFLDLVGTTVNLGFNFSELAGNV